MGGREGGRVGEKQVGREGGGKEREERKGEREREKGAREGERKEGSIIVIHSSVSFSPCPPSLQTFICEVALSTFFSLLVSSVTSAGKEEPCGGEERWVLKEREGERDEGGREGRRKEGGERERERKRERERERDTCTYLDLNIFSHKV